MRVPWPVLIVALVFPTAGALVYFVATDPESPAFRISYAASKFIQFTLPMIVIALLNQDRFRQIRLSMRGFGAGVAVGLAILAAIQAAYWLALRDSPVLSGLATAVRSKVSGFGMDTPGRFVTLAVLLSLAHSFLEEYYWRWFIHGALRERLPPATAILISSTAFAAHHVVVLHIYFPESFWSATLPFSLGVAVGGACWAWLYDRFTSLAGPWAAHALADAALMAIGFDLLYR
jgi:membrane protease YdiL (CAAX protease family)